MNIISWNCRGLGNPETVCELRRMVKKKHPHLLFLMETKVFTSRLQNLWISLAFDGVLTFDPVGRSGALPYFGRICISSSCRATHADILMLLSKIWFQVLHGNSLAFTVTLIKTSVTIRGSY
jgi:hypothetical protein